MLNDAYKSLETIHDTYGRVYRTMTNYTIKTKIRTNVKTRCQKKVIKLGRSMV